MELRFDHIGIVVKELGGGRKLLDRLYVSLVWTEAYADPNQKVSVQFARDNSGIVYELVAPSEAGSPIGNALQSGQNLLHHIAYSVDSLDQGFAHLRSAGCLPLGAA